MPGSVIHYSSTLALPLAGLVILLFLGIMVLGLRRKHLKASRLVLGVFTFPVSLIVTLVIVLLAWWALKALNSNYQVFMAGIYGLDLLVLGLAALAIGLMSACFLWLSRRIGLYHLAAGAMVWWAVLLGVSSLFYPTGSFLFTWPLLLGNGWAGCFSRGIPPLTHGYGQPSWQLPRCRASSCSRRWSYILYR